jgi:hypothetical protein
MVANTVAVLFLGAFLFVQFAVTNHELTVRHAICVQHGEEIDLDGRDTGQSSAEGLSNIDVRFTASNGSPSEEGHHHCLFVSARHTRSVLKEVKLRGVQLAQVARQVVLARPEAHPTSTAIYLSAPKHSPPSV